MIPFHIRVKKGAMKQFLYTYGKIGRCFRLIKVSNEY